MTRFQRWTRLWDRHESPLVLALLRVLFGAILLSDQIYIYLLGLVPTLFGAAEAGGLADPLTAKPIPEFYRLFPPTESSAWLLYGVWTGATVLFTLGLFTRLSGAVALLSYAQFALILPAADRGIDMLVRNVMLVLLFSQSHRMLSLDAWRRTGSWWGDASPAPAWPRHLLILQLVVVYFTAGVQKVGMAWLPMGDFSALYIVLHDPAVVRWEIPDLEAGYLHTQLSTAATMVWEWSAPLLLMSIVYRDSRLAGGRLRALFNRIDFRSLYLLFGVAFHLGIALTMRIGIFPWAMMSLYLCCYHPDELRRLVRRR